jgi:nondiscriminating glutamyl-tRNA synthetase
VVRTRFAPSPTGSLHLGNARIAALNWLFTQRHQGTFVLRIEDTDLERNVAGSESEMLEDLRWLGLEWDEGPGVEGPAEEGPHAPYRQSDRGALYRKWAEHLVGGGLAFPCYCTTEALEARRNEAIARGEPVRYDGACRRLSQDERLRHEREGHRPALRFHVPPEGVVVVEDAVRGRIEFQASEIGDFIILRSDGLPTYNFAVVVDDLDMEISHVIRGVGHLSNTARQILLYRAFGAEVPVFAHVPMVLGPDRQKLSKRHGAASLADYRREGYHPDALVNYLSLLSWSSASGEEFLPRAQLINEISLERVGVADVVFDPAKLRWLSSKHIERMSLEELTAAVIPFIDRERYPIADEAVPAILEAVRSHLAVFADINEHLDPFTANFDAVQQAARDALRADPRAGEILAAAARHLEALDPWEESGLGAAIREAGREVGAGGRALFEPLRIALTGETHGPPLMAVLAVLGRAAALRLLGEVTGGKS